MHVQGIYTVQGVHLHLATISTWRPSPLGDHLHLATISTWRPSPHLILSITFHPRQSTTYCTASEDDQTQHESSTWPHHDPLPHPHDGGTEEDSDYNGDGVGVEAESSTSHSTASLRDVLKMHQVVVVDKLRKRRKRDHWAESKFTHLSSNSSVFGC